MNRVLGFAAVVLAVFAAGCGAGSSVGNSTALQQSSSPQYVYYPVAYSSVLGVTATGGGANLGSIGHAVSAPGKLIQLSVDANQTVVAVAGETYPINSPTIASVEFYVIGADGELIGPSNPLPGSAIELSSDARYLYTSSFTYRIDTTSMSLTPVGAAPVFFHPAYDANNNVLYAAANAGTAELVAFRAGGDGSLTPLTGFPFQFTAEAQPVNQVAVDPSGRFLYVYAVNFSPSGAALPHKLWVFRINANASLTSVGAPVDVTPFSQLSVHPSGDFLLIDSTVPGYSGDAPQFIPTFTVFRVNSDGSLVNVPQPTVSLPLRDVIGFSGDGAYVYASNRDTGELFIFEFDKNTGATKYVGPQN